MNLISLWNQSEFLSDPRLLPGQSGKLSKNDQKDSKYWVDLNITHAREAVKKKLGLKRLQNGITSFIFLEIRGAWCGDEISIIFRMAPSLRWSNGHR